MPPAGSPTCCAEVVDTSEIRPLDIYAVISVRGVLTDYLPTTLRTFLAARRGPG